MNSVARVYLLGAGASMDAGLPSSRRLTELVLERLERDETTRNYLNAIIAGILAGYAGRGENPLKIIPDIEEVALAIQEIAEDRYRCFAFLNNPHSDLIRNLQYKGERDWLRDIDHHEIRSVIEGVTDENMCFSDKEYRINEFLGIVDRAFYGSSGFFSTMVQSSLRTEIVKILSEPPVNSTSYLSPISDHQNSAIISLNYDMLMEHAFKNANVDYDTGIQNWKPGSFYLEEGKRSLIKLHGSISWKYRGGDDADAYRRIRADENLEDDSLSVILFGGRTKLVPDGPFLDMYSYCRSRFRPHEVFVIGYSFRDVHINELLRIYGENGASLTIFNGSEYSLPEEFYNATRNSEILMLEQFQNVTNTRLTAKEGLKKYI